tara:strand:- start:132 stop:689 length:558 start_codon:yes stop_codon:yes gene_type:complete
MPGIDMRIEVNIPEGVSNDHEVAHYTDETTDNMWQIYLDMKSETHDSHTVLLKVGCPMPIMQDSEAEYNEHQWLWDNATGDVLIGGLGLGMCHQPLIDNPDVTSVTIIEVAQDVVDLVWSDCAKDDTFSVVVADFETWSPPEGSSFDTVWGDTWLVDNSLSMAGYRTLITDRYSQYTDNIGFWGN